MDNLPSFTSIIGFLTFLKNFATEFLTVLANFVGLFEEERYGYEGYGADEEQELQ